MIQPKPLDQLDDSKHIRLFGVSDAKIGKTTFMACSALGALPEQKEGLVTSPECLHILAFDEGAVEGLLSFLRDACKRPDCIPTVWPMYDICRTAILNKGGWDYSIYNTICSVQQEIDKVADANPTKVYAELISSFTGMGMALKQSLAGEPKATDKGGGMSVPKWDALNGQLQSLRALVHKDNKHVFWEGHTQEKFMQPQEGVKPGTREETVGVPGGEGRNWAANVKEVSKLMREQVKYPNTSIDKVFLHTRPTLDFNSGGRGFNKLNDKEYDLADMCRKLGKRVGGYKKP